MEQNTFRRIDEYRVALDGLLWDMRPDKAIKLKSLETGFMVHSIKIGETFYYPVSLDKGNKTKNYIQLIEKEK
jgi:hypothetical protein